ncbi:arf-GAP with dual PH domain-containing protein 2 isoform X1 [Arvicola amphibius]|uniref:arf-GAP with dual PH domain-containing protein 2 isoform X1 n=1 Tax=Arvicola amphibius TaxID=1047088 RepID=UPI0018E29BDA|nr:arf-GAP with dual PH domain-containing protein 2 isoform X1 [Arvicola amphibius]
MMLSQLSKVGDQKRKDYRRGQSWPPRQNPNSPAQPVPAPQPSRASAQRRSCPSTPQILIGPLTSWGFSSVFTALASTATSQTSAKLNPCDWTSGTTVWWRVSLHSPSCLGIHYAEQAVLELTETHLSLLGRKFMTHNGNLNAKAKFEARVPAFYYVPQASDCLVLKEQWIRAKYERQEFIADEKAVSAPGDREGFLWKRGRDNAQFLRRRFVLLAREGLLKYYTKEEGKAPKAVINIKDLNATFQTEKIGHPHGLQITYRKEDHTRNLFVYHDSGKEIVDWFNALRAARLQYLKLAFPDLPESELVPLITRNYLKQGFMEKTGPKHREPFKKRWFALDPLERRLLYYKNPLDAFEQGQVFLGSNEQGYEVCEDLPRGIRGNRWKVGLSVITPERKFIFTCPSEKEQREWLESLQDVLSSPLSPLHLLTASAESGCGLR